MKFTYDYTQAEKNNPVGNNSLSSRSKFYQRSLYKEAVYPQDIVSPLDNWYDKNLYGRVNQQQDVILPRQQNLVQLDYGVAPNMYALNFVNRAFSHLVEHMHTAYLTNCIDRILAEYVPTNANHAYELYPLAVCDAIWERP